jgi:hypothetical protein
MGPFVGWRAQQLPMLYLLAAFLALLFVGIDLVRAFCDGCHQIIPSDAVPMLRARPRPHL